MARGHFRGRRWGRGEEADRDRPLDDAGGEVVERLADEVADWLADLRQVGVDQRHDGEPALAEPAVVGECLAEVAQPDDDHW